MVWYGLPQNPTVGPPPPTQPPFPHLGAFINTASVNYSTVPHVGNMSVLMVSNFPGMTSGGLTLTQQVNAIKAQNPNIKIFSYVDIMEIGSGAAFQTAINSDTNNNWYLRTTFPSGSIVISQAGQNSVNITTARPSLGTDAFLPNATYRKWWSKFVTSPTVPQGNYWSPAVAGIYTDNYFLRPRENGDYLETGASQNFTDPTVGTAWRTAYADWNTQLRAAMGSGYLHIGNLSDWWKSTLSGFSLAGLVGILDGGILELAIGPGGTYLEAQLTGWPTLMSGYATTMNALIPPTYMIFHQDNSSATDWPAMRYGLCSCLLDNGYYFYNFTGATQITWSDEAAFNLGNRIAGPSTPGAATFSSGNMTAWQSGVWRADFQNGISLVNPRGNGAKTVNLETTYWKLRQSVDTDGVNNATAVTQVTLPDVATSGEGGGGLILSRTPT